MHYPDLNRDRILCVYCLWKCWEGNLERSFDRYMAALYPAGTASVRADRNWVCDRHAVQEGILPERWPVKLRFLQTDVLSVSVCIREFIFILVNIEVDFQLPFHKERPQEGAVPVLPSLQRTVPESHLRRWPTE